MTYKLNGGRRKFFVMLEGKPLKTLGNFTTKEAIETARVAKKDRPEAYLVCCLDEKTQIMIDISTVAEKEVG
jgi:hypothetical protein